MKTLSLLVFVLLTVGTASANRCSCDVKVYHPTTASAVMKAASMRKYTLNSYDSLSTKNQWSCRNECLQEFRRNLPAETMTQTLVELSQKLIEQQVVGYNCTGLTTFKYPVRVKAKLGALSLGNVADQLEVVTHEQVCFSEDD